MRSQRHLRNNPSPGFFYASCDLLLIYLSCLVHIDFEGHFLGNLLWLNFSKACQVFFTETILHSYFPGWDSILLNHVLTATDAAGLNTPRSIHNQVSAVRRRRCVTGAGIQDPPGRIRAFLFFLKYFYSFIGCAGWVLLLTRHFSWCDERELLFFAVYGLLIAVASLAAEHMLQ